MDYEAYAGSADGWRDGWGQNGRLNPTPHLVRHHDDLLVTAARGSDLWRTASYGHIHDTAHALLTDFPDRTPAEVTFIADRRHVLVAEERRGRE